MTASATHDAWAAANQRWLMAELVRVRGLLESGAAGESRAPDARAPWTLDAPPALDALAVSFGLSRFERDALLCCAGPELDGAFAALCARSGGPTFSQLLATLPQAHWSALSPSAPLRHWRLVELVGGGPMVLQPLRVDERVLHHLAGVSMLDERLRALLQPLDAEPPRARTLRDSADALAALLRRTGDAGAPRGVQLRAADGATARAVAAAACRLAGVGAWLLDGADVPTAAVDVAQLARLWHRETILGAGVLVVEVDDDGPDAERAIGRLLRALRSPTIVLSREPPAGRAAERMARLDVPPLPRDERLALWRAALGDAAARLDGEVERLAEQFALSEPAIARVAAAARHAVASDDAPQAPGAARRVWDACRAQLRERLGALADVVEPRAGWGDLVLPPTERATLDEIALHVRERATVYGAWGMDRRTTRGLGVTALFAGPSGTGKTLAAEVLAGELGLDLYRIDLSQAVSKYIGETEKHLARLFDAAEASGAVLFFDEADALFGKRSEVKDSHDRYANIEVSYLLQRIEAWRGLAILATNLKSALDPAFLRRIRFVVEFPFPGPAERRELWRRAWPAATPLDGIDADALAALDLAGGSIRAVALHAAFHAAGAREPVRAEHVLRAARREFTKLGKPFTLQEA